VAYEHLHRYHWVAPLAAGKRVLELASGEGYGARILAAEAASVVGVDIDPAAVDHAASKYGAANLTFVQGSITRVPISEDQGFDLVVCFEAIEHIEDHESLLSEVKRLLKPEGRFVVSTPNKDVYASEAGHGNPFHVKELSFPELDALLRARFSQILYFAQRVLPASSLWNMEPPADGPVDEVVIQRGAAEFVRIAAEERVGAYFVAVASDAAMRPPAGSVLLDQSDELGRVTAGAIAWKDEQVRDAEARVRELESGLEWARGSIRDLEQTIRSKDETLASRDEALAWRASQVEDLEIGRAALRAHLEETQERLDQTQQNLGVAVQELAEIHQSRGWKAVLALRKLLRYFR
jgi:SAM-dependent methyltransferase